MSSLLHYYRVADLHVNPALQKKANDVGFKMVSSEICYNIQATAALDAEETKKLEYLLRETFAPEKFGSKSFLSGKVVEVAPRQQFTSAWSTNAVSICHSISLEKIVRIEKSRRYQVETSADSLKSFAKLVHDRMTECEYPNGISTFEEHQEPEGWTRVPVMAQGAKALEELSKQKGLGYDEQDIAYYLRVFRDELKRDPTTVECFDLAQGNSEHSRHWFFGGKVVIDGEDMPLTLFQWVKRPLKERISNSVIGFHDNSSALRGYAHTAFLPSGSVAQPSAFKEVTRDFDITLTVETHNFPCGIAPFPGAETGAGGRIRDGESTGKGSLVVAAVAGYATGNLHIPGYKMPWEFEDFKYPSNMAPPLQVLIDCSNGASDYGNKFGEPLICGWTRSCGMRLPSGERFEWVKPIMLSGGLGQMDHGHLVKEDPQAGQLVVKIGGPAYRIGVGGGAASSMVAGDNQEELDFNAVQRGDAEMQQKVNRVVRACVELGPKNPILSIHDQGAGGSGNVLKEISEPAGAVIDLCKMHVGDPSMSFLELWTAEFQADLSDLSPASGEELSRNPESKASEEGPPLVAQNLLRWRQLRQILQSHQETLEHEEAMWQQVLQQQEEDAKQLKLRLGEAEEMQHQTEARVQHLMDLMVALLSPGYTQESQQEMVNSRYLAMIEDLDSYCKSMTERISGFQSALEGERGENCCRALQLCDQQRRTTRLHETLCKLQSELFRTRADPLSERARENHIRPEMGIAQEAETMEMAAVAEEPAQLGVDAEASQPSAEVTGLGDAEDSTDAVPSDPSDRDQPTGDAPSLPLTVPATDDEVLEVLSPKRTVTPRTPTTRAPRAPREQMENLMREILEELCFEHLVVRNSQGYSFGTCTGIQLQLDGGEVVASKDGLVYEPFKDFILKLQEDQRANAPNAPTSYNELNGHSTASMTKVENVETGDSSRSGREPKGSSQSPCRRRGASAVEASGASSRQDVAGESLPSQRRNGQAVAKVVPRKESTVKTPRGDLARSKVDKKGAHLDATTLAARAGGGSQACSTSEGFTPSVASGQLSRNASSTAGSCILQGTSTAGGATAVSVYGAYTAPASPLRHERGLRLEFGATGPPWNLEGLNPALTQSSCSHSGLRAAMPQRTVTSVLPTRSFAPLPLYPQQVPQAFFSPRGVPPARTAPVPRPVLQEGLQTVPCQAASILRLSPRQATPRPMRENTDGALPVNAWNTPPNGSTLQRPWPNQSLPSGHSTSSAYGAHGVLSLNGLNGLNGQLAQTAVTVKQRAASSSPVRRFVQPPVLQSPVIFGR